MTHALLHAIVASQLTAMLSPQVVCGSVSPSYCGPPLVEPLQILEELLSKFGLVFG